MKIIEESKEVNHAILDDQNINAIQKPVEDSSKPKLIGRASTAVLNPGRQKFLAYTLI